MTSTTVPKHIVAAAAAKRIKEIYATRSTHALKAEKLKESYIRTARVMKNWLGRPKYRGTDEEIWSKLYHYDKWGFMSIPQYQEEIRDARYFGETDLNALNKIKTLCDLSTENTINLTTEDVGLLKL